MGSFRNINETEIKNNLSIRINAGNLWLIGNFSATFHFVYWWEENYLALKEAYSQLVAESIIPEVLGRKSVRTTRVLYIVIKFLIGIAAACFNGKETVNTQIIFSSKPWFTESPGNVCHYNFTPPVDFVHQQPSVDPDPVHPHESLSNYLTWRLIIDFLFFTSHRNMWDHLASVVQVPVN